LLSINTISTACQTIIDRPVAVAQNRREPDERLPAVVVIGTLTT